VTTTLPPVDVEVLKRRHPIAGVVEESGVQLRGRGRVLQAPCPFHEDHEPSFTVYRDTQRFYCFGCGVGGDVVDYMRLSRHVDFVEAVRLLEAGSSVRPALIRSAQRFEEPVPPPSPAVLAAAARFYAGQLVKHRLPVDYLSSRGISLTSAIHLGVGHASGTELRDHLEPAGFSPEAIDGSGLFMRDRERFAGRVIVPHVVSGRVTWMTGRAIDASTEPRFQSLPGPKPVLGVRAVAASRVVVLTEGLFDWLTLVQWGLPALATLGCHSLERVVSAVSGCRRVYLAMDADDAGQEATARLTTLLGDRAVSVILPNAVKDVADLAVIPGGRRLFLDALWRAWRATSW
jgi:DNA primase